MKIVSLLPSTTEICYALGLEDQLAAVTHECDFPPAARGKPHITRNVLPPGVTDSAEIDRLVTERVLAGQSIYELDVDLLRRIEPDLILTQQLCEVCAVSYDDVVAVARRLPKPPRVVSLDPHTVDEVLESIRTVGALAGRAETAGAVVSALRRRVGYITGRVASLAWSRRTVCLEWLDPPMIGGHWVPEMVALAGGQDMLGTPGQPSVRVTWEQVRDAAPEVIVLMPCGYDLGQTVAEAERLSRDGAYPPFLADIPAVRRGQVFAVDGSGYFNRPGPRLVGGIEILAGILHPVAFARIGPPGTVRSVPLQPVGVAP